MSIYYWDKILDFSGVVLFLRQTLPFPKNPSMHEHFFSIESYFELFEQT